jgi:hypothetical protein
MRDFISIRLIPEVSLMQDYVPGLRRLWCKFQRTVRVKPVYMTPRTICTRVTFSRPLTLAFAVLESSPQSSVFVFVAVHLPMSRPTVIPIRIGLAVSLRFLASKTSQRMV